MTASIGVNTGEDGVAVVRVSGELDIASAPRLVSAAAEAAGVGAGPVRIDLSAVTFMDSSGLRGLLDAEREIAAAGRVAVLGAPSARVTRVLEMVGFTEHFTVEP